LRREDVELMRAAFRRRAPATALEGAGNSPAV
jgi:hypothetical protein